MNISISLLFILLTGISFKSSLSAQTIPKEELIFLTSEWKGERFENGRPKIPDDLLQRAKRIMIDDAWTVLKNEGYLNQFESGWRTVNDTLMTGRAVTAMYMPSRPDVEKIIKKEVPNKEEKVILIRGRLIYSLKEIYM
jgi:hypothetical protein